MTALALFCGATVAVTMPSDLFVPAARDTEVWGGFEVHGLAAILSAPLHWTIYALGAWAFWTQRRWAPTAAVAYVFYVALCHLVWSEASPHGRGWPIGLLQAVVMSLVGVALLRARATLARETSE
jgi:hypothetical protein